MTSGLVHGVLCYMRENAHNTSLPAYLGDLEEKNGLIVLGHDAHPNPPTTTPVDQLRAIEMASYGPVTGIIRIIYVINRVPYFR